MIFLWDVTGFLMAGVDLPAINVLNATYAILDYRRRAKMARITVDDCLAYVDNAFELVLKASERARKLQLGEGSPLVPPDNDKPTVIALREIALGEQFAVALAKQEQERLAALEEVDDVAQARENLLAVGASAATDTDESQQAKEYIEAFNLYTKQLDSESTESDAADQAADASSESDEQPSVEAGAETGAEADTQVDTQVDTQADTSEPADTETASTQEDTAITPKSDKDQDEEA